MSLILLNEHSKLQNNMQSIKNICLKKRKFKSEDRKKMGVLFFMPLTVITGGKKSALLSCW